MAIQPHLPLIGLLIVASTQLSEDGCDSPSEGDCAYQGAGAHVIERGALSTWASGDWDNVSAAAGAPDDNAAHSPNLDNGEVLSAGDWDLCTPDLAGPITKVELLSRGKTQYDSGQYDILVSLGAQGGPESTWHHTSYGWDAVDVTSMRSAWSFADAEDLVAEIALHSHPGGNRDSDVWIDAFKLRVTYNNGGGGDVPTPRPDPTPPPTGPCAFHGGSLGVGQTWTVNVDAHTGDEATTEPKNDLNDGRNGDNTEFRRKNVARAHIDYWYTSSHQEAGEPSPSGNQWVDYVPNFGNLGTGRYQITAQYRATENRATYPADYWVKDSADGDVLYSAVQHRGEGEYVNVDLGVHFMCEGSYVRIQDPGTASISFNRMTFKYLGE